MTQTTDPAADRAASAGARPGSAGTDTPARPDTAQPPAIEAVEVTKRFGSGASAVTALDAVSLAIRENEFFTLLGPSGCGKTTLLRLVAGFDNPTEGALLLRGEDISALPPYARSVNTVFQSYALFPHMTVAQNIGFGLEMLGRPREEVRSEVGRMLALVRMEALADRRTDQISGGQQQRVALARALAPRPSVLLLDEPLSALDYKLRKDMQVELKRLQSETGITFVFVTHDQEEALTMSDRLAVMSGGKILQVGSPREIYDHPSVRFVADFIGDTNFLEAEIAAVRDGMAEVRLDAGLALEAALAEGHRPGTGERVTVAVRPEHVRIAPEGAGLVDGEVENAVFIGTDTQVSLRLAQGARLDARVQNAAGAEAPTVPGTRVGLTVAPGAAQVLRD